MSGDIIKSKDFIVDSYKVALSVDCVVFGYDEEDKELKILLIKNEIPQFLGKWSLLGDIVRSEETLEDAANRVLEYRTGLKNVYLEEVSTFSQPDRHPLGRVITVAYYALIEISAYELNVEKLDLEAKWFNIKDVGELAFDHKQILNTCHQRLQRRLREQPIGFTLLPQHFTLKQLQNLYETVLEKKFDKRNFRRKLKGLDILMELEKIQKDVAHRPAKLYSFNHGKYEELRNKGKLFAL